MQQRSIGNLVSKRKNRMKVLLTYAPYVEAGTKLLAFTPKDILWKNQKISAMMFNQEKMRTEISFFPDAVYSRCFTKYDRVLAKFEQIIGHGKCFNTINHLDKWKVYALLSKTDLRKFVPYSIRYNPTYLQIVSKRHATIILKPRFGAEGIGIYRIDLTNHDHNRLYIETFTPTHSFVNRDDLFVFLHQLIDGKKYLIQEEVNVVTMNKRKVEIRVIVQKDLSGYWKVSVMYCRIAHEHYFISNEYERLITLDEWLNQMFHSSFRKNSIRKDLMKVSLEAAEILDGALGLLGELSVDFGMNVNQKLFIIEVNGCPTKKSIRDLKDQQAFENVFRRPMEYAQFLAEQP